MKFKDGKKLNMQMVSITLASIINSAINGIVAYVAVYFFKPLWEKITSKLRK
jgi:hypothetical protein